MGWPIIDIISCLQVSRPKDPSLPRNKVTLPPCHHKYISKPISSTQVNIDSSKPVEV